MSTVTPPEQQVPDNPAKNNEEDLPTLENIPDRFRVDFGNDLIQTFDIVEAKLAIETIQKDNPGDPAKIVALVRQYILECLEEDPNSSPYVSLTHAWAFIGTASAAFEQLKKRLNELLEPVFGTDLESISSPMGTQTSTSGPLSSGSLNESLSNMSLKGSSPPSGSTNSSESPAEATKT